MQQTELLVWHTYPDEKPKTHGDKLIQIKEFPYIDLVYYGRFDEDSEEAVKFHYRDTFESIQDLEVIFAFADAPKGFTYEEAKG